ncbi:uncharacterized protein B0H18DRAFT_670319 [Fomitopsis serialis]|uniref:uncharacterized protein n=1 Tax=Fomitopsis serialis TaxID=139415 RepID=UPI00200875B6|nr:uncharacterized protein B0H18DRAFT_670319 [Neoantrodia serialis]KAH9932876.1 hypothetical protein B0H18DRAFT_670319 [Neoantrodia serialis]
MSSRARSKPLAIAVVVGSVATLGYMYVAGTQMKREEGQSSIYKESKGASSLGSSDSNDSRLGSAGVRAAVQGDRKS